TAGSATGPLCQRQLAPQMRIENRKIISVSYWYSWVDSNHRPPDPQSGALNQLSYSCTAAPIRERPEPRRDRGCWQGRTGPRSRTLRRKDERPPDHLCDPDFRLLIASRHDRPIKRKARATGPGFWLRNATLHYIRKPNAAPTQATLRNALVTPLLSGSV